MITLDEFQEKQASARNVFECKRLVENKRHETAIATLLAELNESINAAWDEYLVWVGERKKGVGGVEMSFILYCAGCGHPISVIESWDGIGKKHVRVVVHEWSDKRNHKWNQQNCQYCACDKPEESEAGK